MDLNYVDQAAAKIRGEVDPSVLPDDNSKLLFRIYAVLALAKGASVTPEDVHNAWVAWMTSVDPQHPALVPYDELSWETKQADRPYVDAIRKAVSSRAG